MKFAQTTYPPIQHSFLQCAVLQVGGSSEPRDEPSRGNSGPGRGGGAGKRSRSFFVLLSSMPMYC